MYKVSIKSLAKHKMKNFSKLNTSLNSANTLETLQHSHEIIQQQHYLAKFPKYWVTLIRYSILKSSSFMFCQKI